MLNELAKEIHNNAVAHGWWDKEPSFAEIIALCHSELSEALEEYRNEAPLFCCQYWSSCDTRKGCENCFIMRNGKDTKPEGIAAELADCIIRILDYCGAKGIDIDEIIRIKHEYNKEREYRHGGKVI